MPLDPYIASRAHLMDGLDFHNMTEDMSARMAEFYRDPEPWHPDDRVTTIDCEVPGPHGPVPVRVYRADKVTDTALVWAHGGGFATGDLDMLEADMVATELALRTGALVVSVDYRLAQDGVRYPVPVDDVHAVLEATLGGRIHDGEGVEHVAVGGASAGAALATAAALRSARQAGERLGALLLAYPLLHFPSPGLDPSLNAELAVLPSALRTPASNVEWMVGNYVGRLTDVPADAIPGAAPLGDLPPTYLVISEYDDLRSSAELFARQLTEARVPVAAYTAAGMPHGHLNRSTTLPEVERSLEFFAEALRG